ncbi:hypothetical protein Ancab_039220 [Ancistrocladus abbreviatus]
MAMAVQLQLLQATATTNKAPLLASPPPPGLGTCRSGLTLQRKPDGFPIRASSFFLSPSLDLFITPSLSAALPKFSMRVASGSKQAYICRDCGYIYNDRTPFEKLPDKFFCPVCGAPKRRFRPYEPAVAKNANDTAVRKARKAAIQREDAIGGALPIAIVVGVVALGGLYIYLNNTF